MRFGFSVNLIFPYETFDYIHALLKNMCGVRTIQNKYTLVCNKTNTESQESINAALILKNLHLKLENLFVPISEGKQYQS